MTNIQNAGWLSSPHVQYIDKKKPLRQHVLNVLLLLFIIPFAAGAQQTQPLINSSLKGTVIDAKTKETLIGAIVHIQGTTHEVSTDKSGSFSFVTGQKFPYTLTVSFIGYEKATVVVDQSPVVISLKESFNQLNDVIVVGYGTQKKADLTGAIASISESEFKKTPVTSLDNGLRGRASGVQVTSTSNQPGGGTSIRIRGSNSVNTGSEPLYVIDGFPIYNDNNSFSSGVISGPKTNALALINPNDIVSIEVLKDASATAIYGSRGANGVVLVTSKKGQAGADKIEFNSYVGIQKVAKTIPVLNATDFAKLVNEANGSKIYTDQQIASFGEGINWQNEIFRDAPVQNYQLGVSGGDQKTKYAVSLNYFDQEGVVIHSGFKRYSARFNFEKKLTDQLTFGSTVTSSRTGGNQVLSATSGGEGTIGVVAAALAFSPILPVRNASGAYTLENDRGIPMGNPVATANEITNESFTNRTLANVFAELKLVKGLALRSSVGADLLNNKEKYYAPRTVLAGYTVQGLGRVGSLNSNSWLNENTLSYTNTLGKHSLNALAGFTIQKNKSESIISSASGFVNDNLKADNLGSGAVINSPVTAVNSFSLMSYLGRVNYAYANKYLLTLTARVDGSSKFGANNKYGFFPSGSLAWKLSEEDFIKQLDVFSALKLRGSYGKTGNQEIASYQSLAGLTSFSYIIGDKVVKGFAPGNIPNPDLKWESTAQTDIGLDAGFFNNRLNVTVDAYYKKTTNMLLFINVPWSTGFSSALQNIGSLENKGLELSLNANILDKGLKWNANFNISWNKNKVLDLGSVSQILTGEINGYLKISDPIVIQPGQPLGSFYGYVSEGIFQNTAEVAASAQKTAVPGDRRYADLNGDGKIDASDRKFIGNAQPKFFGGMSHDFAYKSFDLGFSVNWVYGNEILNSTRAELDLPTGQKNSSQRVLNRWTATNPSNTIQRASLNRAFLFSDALLEDGSYLRLNTVTLGYHLPAKVVKALRISNLKVYASALNLLTITHYTGYDPESNQSGQNNILRGIDSDSYPNARTFLLGLNVGF
ncbi:TonB-linked outer membrane protein, SusC/RagA family [Pedobacter westerhofensis]|uniref:TonB-linked outer membrane protein, SusC/RagA family n=1 Tax=Pedobacter westerhofensis TaxID=425512 RepID=A0A521BEG6_9SPHI|nr:TonB-dependent receptor [Pedobacter westerhofensis]SMO45508.1 TonB-linked outer membrane protein, SusC/RagA family [Pedobacter westerhofensis]